MGENVIEDLTVIGEDDPVVAGFTAITKAHDDGLSCSFWLLLFLKKEYYFIAKKYHISRALLMV